MFTLKNAIAAQKRTDREMKYWSNRARKNAPNTKDPVECHINKIAHLEIQINGFVDEIVKLLQ